MTLRLATRRLGQSVAASPSPPCLVPPKKGSFSGSLAPTVQCRHKWSINMFKDWNKRKSKDGAGREQAPVASELDDPRRRQDFLQKQMRGGAEDSIFQEEIEGTGPTAAAEEPQRAREAAQRTRQALAMVTDPDPRSRMRWQRRKVVQMVRRNGELTREERIRMTERELVHKSEVLPTSVKKLVMLARQIAGKPVDEAILQMKWSKKKMAAEVRYYLEEARDLAVASRGMGLGRVNDEILDTPRKIRTKDGKWLDISDPSRMYVAQSWVGRGSWRFKSLDYKGRGRMGVIQHPSTSFTVLLKEERTRIREFEELEAKKAKKGPWVHLPNRPLYGQRPYYTW